MKRICGLLSLAVGFSAFGQDKTAPISLHNLSLHLFQAGNGVLERTFTITSINKVGDHIRFTGSELRPRIGQAGVYEAEYVVFQSGSHIEYGTIVVNIPATDEDANGIPDVVQRDRSYDAPIAGVITPHFVAAERVTISEFAGHISRPANNAFGDYRFNIYADGGSAVSTFKILNGFGFVTYERGKRNVVFLNTDEVDGVRIIGKTSFKVVTENEVHLRAFTVRMNDIRLHYPRLTLEREGDRYIGLRTLRDGNRAAPHRDFRHSLVRIVDAHDADGDGVPDLSDLINTRPTYDGNVVTWGDLADGRNDVPLGATNIIAIATGDGHSLALRDDGNVFAWGRNAYGQAAVPLSATNIVGIAAGTFHSIAARADGTVMGWGADALGQSTTQTFSTGVIALAAGDYHSLALTRDGRVQMWGYAGLQGFPLVPFTATNVVAIAANRGHNMALRADGTVVTWGGVYTGSSYVAAIQPAGLNDVQKIAAGGNFCLALKSNGTVVAWGYMYGTNGYGPANVPDNLSNVVFIAAGFYHSLAITSEGTVVSWGFDKMDNLSVPSFVTNATAVAVGTLHSLAITPSLRP